MSETTSETDQLKKSPQTSEPLRPQPAIEAPQPELEGPLLSLSVGPGLGSPDGFEKRAGAEAQRRNANRQPRVQMLSGMQRQFGNRHVQRFMIQRRSAEGAPVQRQGGGQTDKEDAGTITIDEKGVTSAVYNPPSMTTKNETATPSEGAGPNDDKVDVTATVEAVFKVSTNVNLPSVPGGLTACQTKRVKDAIDKQLKPHEDQHVAAMKQYDGTYTTTATVKGVTRAGAPAALIAAAKPDVDAEGARRKKAAQDASDKLDQPPFVITVDLNCEDEQKPGKKDVEGTGAQPELAGGAEQQPATEGEQPPTEPA